MTGRAEVAELVGTGLLVYVVVGSGNTIERLVADPASSLVLHAIAVGIALAALVALFARTSGAHFNPAVTLARWRRRELGGPTAARYAAAQVIGSIVGLLVALYSFGYRPALPSARPLDWGTLVAEFVGTTVLVLMILGPAQEDRPSRIPLLVGGWVGVAILSSSSTGLLYRSVYLFC
jgi:glycerol uptake facilitator-like aquaporin